MKLPHITRNYEYFQSTQALPLINTSGITFYFACQVKNAFYVLR